MLIDVLTVLGLCCCPRRLLFVAVHSEAPRCGGLSGCRAWAAVVMAHGLSCPTALWGLPGPGINLSSPALADGFLSTVTTREVPRNHFFLLLLIPFSLAQPSNSILSAKPVDSTFKSDLEFNRFLPLLPYNPGTPGT